MKYNFLKLFCCTVLVLIVFGLTTVSAQKNMSDLPLFGAQIFIEPGQTEADIDNWFLMLKENGMKTTRIRMFESYMHKSDGTWDFNLFDMAFKAAGKYDIKVYATIFPLNPEVGLVMILIPADGNNPGKRFFQKAKYKKRMKALPQKRFYGQRRYVTC